MPAVTGTTATPDAALGEPAAAPPLSFQATTVSLTAMPMSWLTPATLVQRSALAVITAWAVTLGVTVRLRAWASMSIHVVPLLETSLYCCVLTAVYGSASLGVTGADASDCGPVPVAFVALTRNV